MTTAGAVPRRLLPLMNRGDRRRNVFLDEDQNSLRSEFKLLLEYSEAEVNCDCQAHLESQLFCCGNTLGALSMEDHLHLWRAPFLAEIPTAEARQKKKPQAQ